MIADVVFTPEVMATGHAILGRAAAASKGDRTASARVDYLRKGLRNAELTMAVQTTYRAYKTSRDASEYRAALRALDGYRVSVETDCVGNMAALYHWENRLWDRSFLKFSESPGIELDTGWRFRWDPSNEGIDKEWSSDTHDDSRWLDIGIDGTWEEQPVGKQWELEHGSGYNGFAWYRNRFTVPSSATLRKVVLAFGAVDEACKVWVNGQFVLDRPYPFKGNTNSWMEAFEIDITDHVRYGKPNVLAVRVEDNSGAGGIWRPVKLRVGDG